MRVKPLTLVRRWVVPEGWGLATAGLVGLAYLVAYPDDHGVPAILIEYAVAVVFFSAISSRSTFPRIDAAQPLLSDVLVKSAMSPVLRGALMAGWVLALLSLDVVLTHRTFLLPAMSLGFGLNYLSWGRRLAKWEDDHAVEFLGRWWRLRVKGLYVRPRADTTTTSGC